MAAEVLGPKMRELITTDGAAMAGDDSAQAPRHAAELAKNDERAFHAALDKEARRVLGEVAAPLLGASAAAAIEKKLAEKGVSPDAATMAKLSQNVGEGVAANAVGRGFNTHEVWKPSKELILPGTSNEKPGARRQTPPRCWATEAALCFQRHLGGQRKVTIHSLRFWLLVTAGVLSHPAGKTTVKLAVPPRE